jgi:xanthine dehydrogenase YagS FAD-binding subunit
MNFEFAIPTTLQEAFTLKSDGARWFAGGTDLVPELKSALASPRRLVNLKRIDELRGIQVTGDGVRIGALTTLTEIAEHEIIRASYRALAQACDLSASPQIRNVATIGGNLCQDSRCPYFRNAFPCFLHGGETCFMNAGENREAAVIGYHDCVHVHPSDPANALVALSAELVVRSRAGERVVAAEDFFHAPDANDRRMTILNADEMITAINLPNYGPETRSLYLKAMDRAAWTFALVSVAAGVERRASRIESARVVLGGVAPVPWQVRIAQTLFGKEWSEDVVTQVAADVLRDAQPLAHNTYKLRLARALVKRALLACTE